MVVAGFSISRVKATCVPFSCANQDEKQTKDNNNNENVEQTINKFTLKKNNVCLFFVAVVFTLSCDLEFGRGHRNRNEA